MKNVPFDDLMKELNETAHDADIKTAAAVTFRLYKEYIRAGFNEQQALQLIIAAMRR